MTSPTDLLLPRSNFASYAGLRVIESLEMVEGPFEDWSDVRSPGRAARRRKQGHRQRIKFYYKPRRDAMRLPDGSLVMHPEAFRALKARAQASEASV